MIEALRCSCGSEDWISCAPGTSKDAKAYAGDNVLPLFAAEEVPTRVWCLPCWTEAFQSRAEAAS